MNSPNDPAFPTAMNQGLQFGLTKREWYAGLAMQAFATAYKFDPKIGDENWQTIAKSAVRQADVLIAELEADNES